jgi:dihydroneopterin aldolase
MTLMLASVTGPEEAEIAIAGGADIIDLKEPAAGALGAVPVERIRATLAAIAGRRSTSAVCGDLPMEPATLRTKAGEIAATGVDYVKVGLFPAAEAAACAAALEMVAASTRLIAVLFADLQPDPDLLPILSSSGFSGVMLDTADKSKGRLLDHLPPERIPAFVDRARTFGLTVGLSGSLEAPDVPRLMRFSPDFLGFRRALSSAAVRDGRIDTEAVRRIRALIPGERRQGGPAAVDYRLLAARGYSREAPEAALGTDRIFVRDFVIPVRIGAYSFEHGHTQKVRFDVSADVLRATETPEDIGQVVSYDIIMDGIRSIVARGHVELGETLAERVASHVLEDPRVTRVSVRVEKLELGPGGVGVEIERRRTGSLMSKRESGTISDREQGKRQDHKRQQVRP